MQDSLVKGVSKVVQKGKRRGAEKIEILLVLKCSNNTFKKSEEDL
jgi:hypothetical protein